jgi:hypothetical protein
MNKILLITVFTLFYMNSYASSLYETKIKETQIYDLFKREGVPEDALQRAFEFLDVNGGKKITVRSKFRESQRTYMGDKQIVIKSDFLAIIDYSKDSIQRRLYVLNLKTGEVSKHFVAHGKGSGVNIAKKFSNIDGSKMSSLGFYIAGNTYQGFHGESLNLYGLEASNNKAAERDIVMHAASYVSEDYIKNNGRLGRSWGCLSVAPGIISRMIERFKDGGVIYAYHKDLTYSKITNPVFQEAHSDHDELDIDLPNEEETLRRK